MIYPIGIQTFEKLRGEGYVYVDKTALIYKLSHEGSVYFLSRPRRFGKSLLLSTMEAYFQGRKELFRGLAIEKLEKKWTVHPVLHLDLNSGMYTTPEELGRVLDDSLSEWERIYGVKRQSDSCHLRFKAIIRTACEKTGQKVVVLIDEYDKPLLEAIGNEALTQRYRDELRALYSELKTSDRYLKFIFLTGVAKFGKVSIFSGLNNLQDISLNADYSTICGISEDELRDYFDESIRIMGERNRETFEQARAHLKRMYDGYHFNQESPAMYNPFSLLNAFNSKMYISFWFATGTPTYLVRLLLQRDYDLYDMENEQLDLDDLSNTDVLSSNIVHILYQSGYLTIKDYDFETYTYTLGFPNEEVSSGFSRFLLPYYTGIKEEQTTGFISDFTKDIRAGRVHDFMKRLQTALSDRNYQVAGAGETDFHNVVYLIFKLLSYRLDVQAERPTSDGRIDIQIKAKDYVYIFELKYNGTSADALQQIEAKRYADPFVNDPRHIYKIGVNFSGEHRKISDYWIAGEAEPVRLIGGKE